MSKSFGYSLLTLALYVATAIGQPTTSPPAVVGPQTISSAGGNAGFYEYFTQGQPDTWKGDIKDIFPGETYWVYITGIDVSQIQSSGQTVRFSIWDAEQISTLKGLAITFSLNNPQEGGVDFLQIFQTSDNFESSQSLAPGTLAAGKFDLRVSFFKETSMDPWTITGYYHLPDSAWKAFGEPSITPTSTFNFSAAKLQAGFYNAVTSPADMVSFDNFFLLGPVTGPFTASYVDDDWADLEPGDAVFFPGSDSVHVYEQDAFSNIQDAIFAVAPADDTIVPLGKRTATIQADESEIGKVFIAPGTYEENIFLPYHIDLIGSGSGEDPEVDTIIEPDNEEATGIWISGVTAHGTAPDDVLLLKSLRVRNAVDADGILVTDFFLINIDQIKLPGSSKQMTTQRIADVVETAYITFDDVTSTGNDGSGINFDHYGYVHDIIVKNCTLTDNDYYGLDIPETIDDFSLLKVDSCLVSGNSINGVIVGPTSADAITISNSTFQSNGHIGLEGGPDGDIYFYNFNGGASFSNLQVTGGLGWFGILLSGYNGEGTDPAGIVSFNDVLVNGPFYSYVEDNAGGITLRNYSDISSISFNDVILNVDIGPPLGAPLAKSKTKTDAAPALLYTTNLQVYSSAGDLNIANTTFGGTAEFDIYDFCDVDIDAKNATFSNAEDDFEIEDRVEHVVDFDEFSGLVTWKEKNLFFTTNSFILPYTSYPDLRRPIGAAATNDTINLAPQEFYIEPQISIDKSLVLRGVDSSATRIYPDDDTGNTGDSKAWFLVTPSNKVDVEGITFDGVEGYIYEAFRTYGTGTFSKVQFKHIGGAPGSYQGTAIYVLSSGAVNVLECTFQQIGRTGVRYAQASEVRSTYSGNHYTGKNSGDYLDYGVVIENGADVEILNSTIEKNNGIRSVEKSPLRKEGPADNMPATTIATDTSSAAVLILSKMPQGTVAHITDTDMFGNQVGVQIGKDTGDASFVIINGGSIYSNQYGVVVHSALYLNIEQAQIHSNTNGIDICYITVIDFDKNHIFGNNIGIGVISSFGEIDNNILYENVNGIEIRDEESTEITINGNEFCTHEGLAMLNLGTSYVDATGNWWGAADGPGGDGTGSGEAIDGNIDYTNFKTNAFDPESPCAPFALCVRNGDVNNNGSLSPADAIGAFKIFLNDGTLPQDVDIPDFECEIPASDVNCSESVTPADALAIFQRFLDENPPAECFAAEPMLAKGAASSIYLAHEQLQKSGEEDVITVSLNALNFDQVRAFGLRVAYPANLKFLGVERSALTSSWTQLDARAGNGHLTVGGFTTDDKNAGAAGGIVELRFEAKGDFAFSDIQIVDTFDDLDNAVILSTEDGLAQSTPLPTEFGLDQNYPNPFNPSTRISFQIPARVKDGVHVSLKVFNVGGQVIRTLVNENKVPGTYEVEWDGKNLSAVPVPSGTYFYVIQAGEFKETRKMMLIK